MLKPVAVAFVGALCAMLLSSALSAHPFPPLWNGGAGVAVHHPPVLWPSEPLDPRQCGDECGDWRPYTRFQQVSMTQG